LRNAAVYLALFLIGTETFLVSPLLPAIAGSYHVPTGSAATSVTSYVLCYAVSAPLLGTLCDRFGRRRFILLGSAIFLTGNLVAAVAPSLVFLILARAVAGVGGATAGPAIWAYLGETSSPETRGRAIGIGMACFSLGQVLGVPLGGLIAAASSWHYAFAAVGFGLLATLPLTARLQPTPGNPGAAPLSGLLSIWVRSDAREIRQALSVTLLFQAASLGAYTYLGTLLATSFHLRVGVIGLTGILVGAGSVAGSMLGGHLGTADRGDRLAKLLALWSLLLACSLAVVAESGVLALTMLAVVTWFIASGGFVTNQQTLLVSAAPDRRAASASWNNTAMYVGTAAGVWLVGIVPHLPTGLVIVGPALALCALASAAVLRLRFSRTNIPLDQHGEEVAHGGAAGRGASLRHGLSRPPDSRRRGRAHGRRGRLHRDGGPLLRGVVRAAHGHRDRRARLRRACAARRRVQAQDLAVRLPGPGQDRP
jgi:DHA1 family inner membrane transport protein